MLLSLPIFNKQPVERWNHHSFQQIFKFGDPAIQLYSTNFLALPQAFQAESCIMKTGYFILVGL